MKYIAQLRKQQTILDELFDRKEMYNKRYRKKGWTGKEVLIHIKDSETVSYDRIRRVIAENRPILWFFEQDLWQEKLNYMKQDLVLAKKVFMLTRESIIESIEMHLSRCAKNQGIHSRRGTMTLKQLIEFLIWHTDHHIRAIQKIHTVN